MKMLLVTSILLINSIAFGYQGTGWRRGLRPKQMLYDAAGDSRLRTWRSWRESWPGWVSEGWNGMVAFDLKIDFRQTISNRYPGSVVLIMITIRII